MANITVKFTDNEIETLKKLIKELDSYYDYDIEFDNHAEEWDFEDLDAQREIALEIANVLRDKF
jgi:hypothetical protein